LIWDRVRRDWGRERKFSRRGPGRYLKGLTFWRLFGCASGSSQGARTIVNDSEVGSEFPRPRELKVDIVFLKGQWKRPNPREGGAAEGNGATKQESSERDGCGSSFIMDMLFIGCSQDN